MLRKHSWADAHPGDEPFLGEQISALHDYEHGYPDVVCALTSGGWTVLVQPAGFRLTGAPMNNTLL
ncbi:hypothetical protein ACFOWZ_25785 [Lentzea rhizosphaerae]|uniref:Uncharacterized protein n=1 Tax=Lentzea rhizosphaerae TaxID=2041025 RepID=A0ABV8BYY9_9PSEU